jgi:hypothetical protein
MESGEVRPAVTRCRRLRRLSRDTEGGALLEAVVTFPVLLLFILTVMELSLLFNARQLANYAAFCAARTAAVYGADSTVKTHLAAAMAMTSISPATADDAAGILSAYGLSDPNQTVAVLCSIPGFQGENAQWLSRLANAFVRTGEPTCVPSTSVAGRRRHVEVDVTYLYRCSILPFGRILGRAGLKAYIDFLRGKYGAVVEPVVGPIYNSPWNIQIRGRAVADYWAD